MTSSRVLEKLIRACVDDGRTLRHECKFVDADRASTLMRLALERERFVTDLERLAGHAQPHDGSWSDLAREAGRNLRVLLAGRNSGDAIASCRQSRARTESAYDVAIDATWPDDVQRLLLEQRRRIRAEGGELDRILF